MAQRKLSLGHLKDIILYDDSDVELAAMKSDDPTISAGAPVALVADGTQDAAGNFIFKLLNLLGGGSAAPANAEYVTLAFSGNLSDERVLTGTTNQITITDGGANSTVTLSLPQDIHLLAVPQFKSLLLSDSSTLDLKVTHTTGPVTNRVGCTSSDAFIGTLTAHNVRIITSNATRVTINTVGDVTITGDISVSGGGGDFGIQGTNRGNINLRGNSATLSGALTLWLGDSVNSVVARYILFTTASNDDLVLKAFGGSASATVLQTWTAQLTVIFPVAVDFGTNSANRGIVTIWDGSGGNKAGYTKFHSRNGTAYYLWFEDDGTLKRSTAAPVNNADGTVVGAQT